MADSTIHALTDGSTAAATDEVVVTRSPYGSGDDRRLALSAVKTLVNTAPSFAAGTSSSGTHPVFNDGTLLTTTEHGAMEHAGSTLYFTPSSTSGARGVVKCFFLIRAGSTRTFTSNTSSQAIFTTPASGSLNLDTGTYLFEGILNIGSMSATSGNLRFELLGAGTATLGAILYHVVGVDGATATAATQTGSTAVTANTPNSAVTAGIGTAATLNIRGSFEVSSAGTIIPSITMVTAAASVLAVGSYLAFTRVGDTSLTSVGPWS